MRLQNFLTSFSMHQRSKIVRKTHGRRLGYESLESRRVLAGVSVMQNGSVLTIAIDGDTEAAFISQTAFETIKVDIDAAGAMTKGTFTGITQIEVVDNNAAADAQSVTFKNAGDISLPDGLFVDSDIESTTIGGRIADVGQGAGVYIGSGLLRLGADILTRGGAVRLFGALSVTSNVTIATGRNGALFAGDISLMNVNGPGGLVLDATTDNDNGNDGDVEFWDVGAVEPLAHFSVSTNGVMTWDGRRILTDGEVNLSASLLNTTAYVLSTIDSQSLPNQSGGNIKLDFAGIGGTLLVLQLNASGDVGEASGAVSLPFDFQRIGSMGTSAVFQEPTSLRRILVNESALEPLFEHDFASNAGNVAIKPQPTTNGTVANNRYQIAPTTANGTAIALIDPLTLPANFAFSATVNMSGAGSGYAWSNGLLIFDFVDMNTYKYAGAADGANQYVIGEVTGGVAQQRQIISEAINSNTNVNLRIEIRGATIELFAGGINKLTHTFGGNLVGGIGIGAMRAKTTFDDLLVLPLA